MNPSIKIVGIVLGVTAYYTYFGQMVPQKEVQPPENVELTGSMTTVEMVAAGKKIFEGKGTCLSCHKLSGGTGRFPDMGGVGSIAGSRKPGYSDIEYLAESLYEPNVFIVPGYNPGMPVIHKPPIGLTDMEIKATIAYLQSLGGTPTITMATKLKYEGGDKGGEGGAQEAVVAPKRIPAIDFKRLRVSSPQYVQDGKKLYLTNCSSCHGEQGDGKSAAAEKMNPKPRDFTALAGWTNGAKVSQIFVTLEEGIVANGMPPATYLSKEDRFKIIHFIRSLSSGAPQDTEADFAALDKKYSLSQEINIPGRIPIDMAMEHMAVDSAKYIDLGAPKAGSTAPARPAGPGAALVERFSCKTCHSLDSTARLVGPSLFNVGSRLSKAALYEEILDPDSHVPAGYPTGLMKPALEKLGFYEKTSPKELTEMVNYLAERKGK